MSKFWTEFTEACQKNRRQQTEIKIVAVTKNRTSPEVNNLLQQTNLTVIGENRVQEAAQKFPALRPCERHLIGHLQSNKAKLALELFDVLESVDSIRLAQKISTAAQITQKTVPILLQVNFAAEPQKFGFREADLEAAFKIIQNLPNLKVQGLMVIGVQNDPAKTQAVFKQGKLWQQKFNLPEFSAGMSNDFALALACGATIVRVGRALFENSGQ